MKKEENNYIVVQDYIMFVFYIKFSLVRYIYYLFLLIYILLVKIIIVFTTTIMNRVGERQ